MLGEKYSRHVGKRVDHPDNDDLDLPDGYRLLVDSLGHVLDIVNEKGASIGDREGSFPWNPRRVEEAEIGGKDVYKLVI